MFSYTSILSILSMLTGSAQAGVCSADYDTSDYNALPSLEFAEDRWSANEASTDDLLAAGAVLADFDLLDEGAAALLHKHFGLQPGERLVRSRVSEGYLVCPVDEPGVEIPYMFALRLGSDGRYVAVPLEFVRITEGTKAIAASVSRLISNDIFIQAFGAELSRRGVIDQIGLTLNPRLFIENPAHDQLIETSGGERSLLLSSGATNTQLPEGAVQVIWTFEKGASGTVAGICLGCCKAHCVKHSCGGGKVDGGPEDGNCVSGAA